MEIFEMALTSKTTAADFGGVPMGASIEREADDID